MTYFQFAGCHGRSRGSVASLGPASTVWPGKWDLAVKRGTTPHLPALLNTPLLHEANLLPPRAGSSTCPRVACSFSPDRLTLWCSAFQRGEFKVTSPEKSVLCSALSRPRAITRLTRGCRWLIEPSARPRGVCGAGHTRLRPLEAGGRRQPPAVGLGHSRSSSLAALGERRE